MQQQKREPQKKHKILIIKTGYAEILDKESDSRIVSLGDVLRTTPLLKLFKNDHVTWVTDKKAYPLLKENSYIDRLLDLSDPLIIEQLKSERFDTLINLEKIPAICALTEKIKAWRRFGFRFNPEKGTAEAYDKAFEVLAVGSAPEYKKANTRTAQELLFKMVGKEWNGEDYILEYKPNLQEFYDIGLNPVVGTKWPTKAWSIEKWDELEQKLKKQGFKLTRQDRQGKQVTENLYGYIDWINSCKLLVTPDSLGLHLALALKKKVLGLFGPTPNKEVYFYNRGKAILPEPIPECIGCFEFFCKRGRSCMEDISVERVCDEVKKIFKNESRYNY